MILSSCFDTEISINAHLLTFLCLPSELGDLRSLVSLRLDDNHLSGYLPSELGLIGESLQILDVSINYAVNGTLPTELGLLKNLTHFFAYQTSIHGLMPLEIAALVTNGNLVNFHMRDTLLYGTIPNEMCSIDLITFDCGTHLCGCWCSCSQQYLTTSVNCADTPDLCRL
jgi:hypothetical protein